MSYFCTGPIRLLLAVLSNVEGHLVACQKFKALWQAFSLLWKQHVQVVNLSHKEEC